MNQKLRTARNGIVILLAILSIVCLSLSLALSAHFAAYAEGTTNLPMSDGTNDLWQIHYTVQETDENGEVKKDAEGNVIEHEVVEGLLDGVDKDGKPLTYLAYDANTNATVVTKGSANVKNYFTPYRGGAVISIVLNGAYTVNGNRLDSIYDFSKIQYVTNNDAGNSHTGYADVSTPYATSVTVPSKTAGDDPLTLSKDWMIATYCNEVDSIENYISGSLGFASAANYAELRPVMGTDIVYDFQSGSSSPIVVRYENGVTTYFNAIPNGADYEVMDACEYDSDEVDAEGGFINYTIRHLNVGDYSLKVTALSKVEDDIYYAPSSVTYNFKVTPQSIDGDTFLTLFGKEPTFRPNSVDYTGDSSWIPTIELSIGTVKLTQDVDFYVTAESIDVGMVNVRITGNNNLTGSYLIENAIQVKPATNTWDVNALPNISSWSYGDYNKITNKIIGLPVYPSEITNDNIRDILFQIVSVDSFNVETALDGLSDIHYEIVVDGNGDVQYLVSDNVANILAKLHVGKYRLIASVYGVNVGDAVMDRNYQPIRESRVDFEVRTGNNSWGESTVPTIVSWTAGKYDSTKNIITAVDRFGNEALVLIRDSKGNIVYSNHPEHANQDYGVYGKDADYATKIFKSFKAGYYTLRAEIKTKEGTVADYNNLDTLIDFSIARNGLPTWAVILIVIGALGVVVLVFTILHQKGVLQMLTGKVIISMRTRANVDATIAAVRAAKMAREAEASIAAAKAREAEENAKENKE